MSCGYAGGVDEIVDWSKTAPKRTQKRPADSAGDFDDKVWRQYSSLIQCLSRADTLEEKALVPTTFAPKGVFKQHLASPLKVRIACSAGMLV